MNESNEITPPEQLQIELLESVARQDAGLRKKMDTIPNRPAEIKDSVILNYFEKAKAIYNWQNKDLEKYWEIYKKAFERYYKEL